MMNQMSDVILLDSSHAYSGASLAYSDNMNLEVSAREHARSVSEEWTLGEIDWSSVSASGM